MVNQTTFTTVTDGDYLSQGYFNGILPAIFSASLGINDVTHTFTSDVATTKTNFTYDADEDLYYASSGSSVLIMPSTAATQYLGKNKISKALLEFDYYVMSVYDETNDSSADMTLWDDNSTIAAGRTITEDTSKLRLSGSSSSESNVYIKLATDATNGTFTNETVRFKTTTTNTNGGFERRVFLKIKGASSGEALIETLTSATHYTNTIFEMSFDSTQQKVIVRKNGSLMSGSPFDLSGLTGNYIVQIEVGSVGTASDTMTIDMFYFRVMDGTETTTVTQSLSSNAGTNYSTTSNRLVTIPSSEQGATMIPKLTSTVQTGELLFVEGAKYFAFVDGQL